MKFIGESGLVREDDKIVIAENTSTDSVDSTDSLRIIRFREGGVPNETMMKEPGRIVMERK